MHAIAVLGLHARRLAPAPANAGPWKILRARLKDGIGRSFGARRAERRLWWCCVGVMLGRSTLPLLAQYDRGDPELRHEIDEVRRSLIGVLREHWFENEASDQRIWLKRWVFDRLPGAPGVPAWPRTNREDLLTRLGFDDGLRFFDWFRDMFTDIEAAPQVTVKKHLKHGLSVQSAVLTSRVPRESKGSER